MATLSDEAEVAIRDAAALEANYTGGTREDVEARWRRLFAEHAALAVMRSRLCDCGREKSEGECEICDNDE